MVKITLSEKNIETRRAMLCRHSIGHIHRALAFGFVLRSPQQIIHGA